MRFPGIFRCGPSPLNAVRQGDVYLPFDSKFVYAEVNADRVYWLVKKVDGRNEFFRLSTETQGIGVNISTKAVGEDKRRDITWEYKYPEGDCPILHSTAREPWPPRSPPGRVFFSGRPQGWLQQQTRQGPSCS